MPEGGPYREIYKEVPPKKEKKPSLASNAWSMHMLHRDMLMRMADEEKKKKILMAWGKLGTDLYEALQRDRIEDKLDYIIRKLKENG